MSEQAPKLDVQEMFDPELRAQNQQAAIYENSRPDQDAAGNVLHPVTGEVIDPNTYFDGQRQIHEENSQTAYEDMSVASLARKLGEAEFHNDRTTQANISEVLLEKMAAEEAKAADKKDSSYSIRGVKHSASDDLWERVMTTKDREVSRLREANQSPATKTKRKQSRSDNPHTPGNTAPVDPLDRVSWNRDDFSGEYQFDGQIPVRYSTRDDGRVQLGLVVKDPGTILDWQKHSKTSDLGNRKIIVTDVDGNRYFVVGNKVYDVTSSVETGELDKTELEEDLPNVEIGKPWTWTDGRTTAGDIAFVEIATELADAERDVSAYRAVNQDTFLDIKSMLSNLTPTGRARHGRQSNRGASDRIQNAYLRPFAWLNARDTGRQPMTRRGRVAFAVGGLLTGGTAAYLGVKYGYSVGSGSSAHVAANLPIGSSGTGHSLIAHAHEAKVGNHHSAHSVHNHSKTQQTTSPDSPGKHFPTTAILKRGKNPWDIALRQLHLHGYLHPTDAQIQSYDMHMLHQTYPGLTEDELLEKARHLGVGTRLKLPRIRAR